MHTFITIVKLLGICAGLSATLHIKFLEITMRVWHAVSTPRGMNN